MLMPQLLSLLSFLRRAYSRTQRSGLYLLLGIAISLLCVATRAQATETVLLEYGDLKRQVPLAVLEAFVADRESGERWAEFRQFLQDTRQDPAEVKQWLTQQITLLPLVQNISSEFVLLQLNKLLGDQLGREANLSALRDAFTRSIRGDRSFSILEILENYRSSEQRLDLSRLKQVYTDVNQLVTRIQPVLKVAEALLPELLCDCNAAADNSAQAIAYDQSRAAVKALLPVPNGDAASPKQILDPTLIAQLPSDSPALANQSLVIEFGPFGRSIALQDLTRFAETGELSRGWRFFFNVGGVDPADVQTALNQDVGVSLLFLDSTLNNLLGEFLLYEIGQIIHTPSRTANIQALRAASILSVADDGRLSLLELLQRYPTRQVHIDGLRLARLGSNASRLQARLVARVGGVRTGVQQGVRAAVISLEDWLVQLQAAAAETVCQCDAQAAAPAMVAPTISPAQIAQFLPPNWQPVAAHREDRGIIKVVWLQGTPYEMGYQHGQYLHDEIASLGSKVLGSLRFAGRGLALGQLAASRSYPAVVEECRGLADATQDIGMTLDACLVLAYGDVLQEVFANTLPEVLFWDGCSQWVASGNATVDGRLYHGSTLDNDEKPIDYIMNNPVVFVRQPNDGLPHVFITYPAVVWPNWGLNVAGISLGLDTLHPSGPEELSFDGGSIVQTMGQILRTATSFAEARQTIETQPRVQADLVMIADAKSKEAGVFELTGRNMAVRELPESGVLYVTNHAASEEMYNRQRQPIDQSTLSRFKRLAQLMEPDGSQTFHGRIDPAAMAKIGRDRVNPNTLVASPFDLFDDDASPGGNGSLRQGLYDADKLLLWVAAGSPPVPENPFVCFSLGEMLNFPNAIPCESPAL